MDKRFPFVRRLQVDAVVFFFCFVFYKDDSLWYNLMELEYC